MSAIINALEKALQSDPANWETRLSLTESYLNEDRGEDAVALFEEVTLPENESGLIAAARCYALLDSPHAREILDPVLEANPDNGYAQLALAFITHRTGDPGTAQEAFTKAIDLGAAPSDTDSALVQAYGASNAAAPDAPIPRGKPQAGRLSAN